MGISIYNIKRWARMLIGTSIYHVEQGVGKAINKGGYYNDLTQKVLMGDGNLDENGIPFLEHSDGSHISMPTMIFQYGLGAYDLYLLENKKIYFNRAEKCANWAMENQDVNGRWNNFYYIYPDNPYSAMSQGEGASLLLRVYKETKNEKYLLAAKRAIDFMLTDVSLGGVSKVTSSDIYLLEYTHLPIVLNGWIFAAWGLYDISIYFPKYKDAFYKTIDTLIKELHKYDNGFWSMYDQAGMITSPFYHKLHIAQLDVMYQITKKNEFKEYRDKFVCYNNNFFCRKRAFAVKALQKIREKDK